MITIAYAASQEGDNPLIGYLLWALLLGFVLVLFIKRSIDKKKYSNVKFENDTDWLEKSLPLYPEDNKVYQYYFHFDKNFFASGHLMEDRQHKLIYEAKFLYNNMLGNDEVDFINHILHCKSHHQISHTKGSSAGGDNGSVVIDSSFKFDNVNAWSYLENLGYTYQSDQSLTTYSVQVFDHGMPIGKIFTTNMGKDYFAGKDLEPKLGGNGYFIVEGENKYMDILFLYAIIFARTEISLKHR